MLGPVLGEIKVILQRQSNVKMTDVFSRSVLFH